MNSFKWLTGSLKNLRISGGSGGKVVQARSPPLASNLFDKKLPVKPKRPSSPYIKFTQQIRDATVKANPKLKVTEIMSVLAQQWKALSPETKEGYAKEFKVEMADYSDKYSNYKKSLSAEQKDAIAAERAVKGERKIKMEKKRLLKELGKPKKPMSGFLRFLQSQPTFEGKPLQTFQQRTKDLSLKWNAMSDQEKAPYIEEYKKKAEQYKADLDKWELKMRKLGNMDVTRSALKPHSTEAKKKKQNPSV